MIDNRLGAGGNIGAEFVAKAPADGYTLLMSSVTTQAINMSLLAKPPYDFVRDYAPVALVASAPLALVIHASLPAKSVREFIALAKAHPGELNYFSSGTGTGTHLAAVIFDQLAGVRTTHVPYKGGAQGLGDLLSGQVQFAMSTIGLVEPHVQTGRLRLLGVGSVKRYTRLPDIPTIAESGVKGYEAEQWYGVVGRPAHRPRSSTSWRPKSRRSSRIPMCASASTARASNRSMRRPKNSRFISRPAWRSTRKSSKRSA